MQLRKTIINFWKPVTKKNVHFLLVMFVPKIGSCVLLSMFLPIACASYLYIINMTAVQLHLAKGEYLQSQFIFIQPPSQFEPILVGAILKSCHVSSSYKMTAMNSDWSIFQKMFSKWSPLRIVTNQFFRHRRLVPWPRICQMEKILLGNDLTKRNQNRCESF